MNKKVDPEKLKEAAELLEQAILSYPRDEKIAALHESLSELIVDAKKYKIKDALERRTIPCYRPFAEGYFREYKEPDIEHAYMNFSVELRGGRSDAEKEILFSLAERLEKSHEK